MLYLARREPGDWKEMRRAVRLPVSGPIVIEIGKVDIAGEVLDLSRTGAGMMADKPLKVGEVVRVVGQFGSERVTFRGEVIRSDELDGKYACGLKFVGRPYDIDHQVWLAVVGILTAVDADPQAKEAVARALVEDPWVEEQ